MRHSLEERLSDRSAGTVVLDDLVGKHVSLKDSHALIQVQLTSVDLEGVLRFVVRSRDSGEVRNNASTGFLVKSLRVSLFTGFERRVDPDFLEELSSTFVSRSSSISGSSLR
jgi:hypothetical protein